MTNQQDTGNLPARQPIPKRLRFEVLKRDKFACIYCGATAAQKLLHCDHVVPVAEGGETTILNLVAACADCNLGKGARPLSDDTAMSVQHSRLAELEERQQQLEMMRKWREELENHTVSEVDIAYEAADARSAHFSPGDSHKRDLRRWIRKYGLVEVLESIDESFDQNFTKDEAEVWALAFARIGRALAMRQQEKTDPHIRKLLYINGILRNRFNEEDADYVEKVRDALSKGYPIEVLETYAKAARSWSGYVNLLNAWMARTHPPAPPASDEDPSEDDDGEPDFVGWEEAGWRGEMFANALSIREKSRELLTVVAGQCGIEGYMSWEMPEYPNVVSGFRAVGLLNPVGDKPMVMPVADGWSVHMHLPPISPMKIADCFNRFGALRLSFWDQPRRFARVGEVY